MRQSLGAAAILLVLVAMVGPLIAYADGPPSRFDQLPNNASDSTGQGFRLLTTLRNDTSDSTGQGFRLLTTRGTMPITTAVLNTRAPGMPLASTQIANAPMSGRAVNVGTDTGFKVMNPRLPTAAMPNIGINTEEWGELTDDLSTILTNAHIDAYKAFGNIMTSDQAFLGAEVFRAGGIPASGTFKQFTVCVVKSCVFKGRGFRYASHDARLAQTRYWTPGNKGVANIQRGLTIFGLASTIGQGFRLFNDLTNLYGESVQTMNSYLPGETRVLSGPSADTMTILTSDSWTNGAGNSYNRRSQQTMTGSWLDRRIAQRSPTLLFDPTKAYTESVQIHTVMPSAHGYPGLR